MLSHIFNNNHRTIVKFTTQNERKLKPPHQKMKIKSTAKVVDSQATREPLWQRETPQHFYKVQRKPTHRNTQAGSKYTQRQLGSF